MKTFIACLCVTVLVVITGQVSRALTLQDVALACSEQGWYVTKEGKAGSLIFCATRTAEQFSSMTIDDLPLLVPESYLRIKPEVSYLENIPWTYSDYGITECAPDDFSDTCVGCVDCLASAESEWRYPGGDYTPCTDPTYDWVRDPLDWQEGCEP